ncbi:hypothetical protein TELCIR_13572 [Teladorsagia circumcincta]|uniref:Uncharacterized protein n=1 Tax=Teladorsagia circumcincta TaxID=45464 RepID=A0A2G9U3G2_TELCI|nr:hypothetical protein TELCIR_13572 [Teladorsagia circumcincta]
MTVLGSHIFKKYFSPKALIRKLKVEESNSRRIYTKKENLCGDIAPNPARNSVYYDNGGTLSYPNPNTRPEIPSYRSPDTQPPLRLDSLSPRPQQPVISPNLVPVTTTQPRPVAATTVTPAPLNYWPDQPQPIKNIMDSDI